MKYTKSILCLVSVHIEYININKADIYILLASIFKKIIFRLVYCMYKSTIMRMKNRKQGSVIEHL